MKTAIEIRDLTVAYRGFLALDAVSLAVAPGEAFGLVGESGSGKSTLLRAIVGLAPTASGVIRLHHHYLKPERDKAFYRTVQMVFQDPYASLHPRQTVDRQLREPLAIQGMDSPDVRIVRALDEVGLGQGFRYRYPHQLSGGQRQRVSIARALILEPSVLLLDEPTSALDASIQAEVLNLLDRVRRERGLTYLMVSHDLAVIGHMCTRLLVMRSGRAVETLSAEDLARRRVSDPYSAQLLAASEGFRRVARLDAESRRPIPSMVA